jgi:FkbM family methyltransferase
MATNRTTRLLALTGVFMLVALAAAYQLGRAAGANFFVDQAVAFHYADDRPLLDHLVTRYGPDRNSEDLEEWIIRDAFQDRRDGVFADVGANHYKKSSNTYFLEHDLGWSGVAIEPQQGFAMDYQRFRPRTVFVPLFVSDTSNQQATLYVPKKGNSFTASSDRDFAASYDRDVVPTPTTTTTLDDILARLGITHVDFLNMDIEMHEPEGLAGFSIDRYRPELVCIEAHLGVRERILDYFHRHGYVLVGRYLRIDGDNLWFAPAGAFQDDARFVTRGHGN